MSWQTYIAVAEFAACVAGADHGVVHGVVVPVGLVASRAINQRQHRLHQLVRCFTVSCQTQQIYLRIRRALGERMNLPQQSTMQTLRVNPDFQRVHAAIWLRTWHHLQWKGDCLQNLLLLGDFMFLLRCSFVPRLCLLASSLFQQIPSLWQGYLSNLFGAYANEQHWAIVQLLRKRLSNTYKTFDFHWWIKYAKVGAQHHTVWACIRGGISPYGPPLGWEVGFWPLHSLDKQYQHT